MEAQVRGQVAAWQAFWLVPLNSKPPKAALDAGTECQNEVEKRRKGHGLGSPHKCSRGVSGRPGKDDKRQGTRSTPVLQQAIVCEPMLPGIDVSDVHGRGGLRGRGGQRGSKENEGHVLSGATAWPASRHRSGQR